MSLFVYFRTLLGSGSLLLAISAVISKLLSLLRDRGLLEVFDDQALVDAVYASFRIPDFFFWLLVSSCVALTFIPRIQLIDKQHYSQFFSSFFWWVFGMMSIVVLLGQLFLPQLVPLFAGGFDADIQIQIVHLSRYLFISIWFLSLSSVFSAYLQSQKKFWPIALAPLLYMGSLVIGILFFGSSHGVSAIGLSAIFGAILHLILLMVVCFGVENLTLVRRWKSPDYAFIGFTGDFLKRVLNGSIFQINQSVDILIASFLIVGSVTSFSLGTALGHVLLSILAFPISHTAFPRLAESQGDTTAQKKILLQSTKWILLFSVPFSVLCALFSELILKFVFGLDGDRLFMTDIVFFWTVLSLPAACLIPLWSRFFLANNNVSIPLKCNFFALTVAMGLAAYLSLFVFEGTEAILGLALGNFTANVLNALLFGFLIYRYS